MKVTLRYKLFLYTGGLMAVLLLAALMVLERTQSRQWEAHFQTQSLAFARLATPELLKRFRGEFAPDARPLGADVQQLLAFNRDLVEFSLSSPSGRLLYQSPRLSDFIDLDLSRTASRTNILLDSPYGIDTAVVLTLVNGGRVLELVTPALGPTGEQLLTIRFIFSYDSVDVRLREVRNRLLLVAAGALLLALLCAALVSRRLTKPIHALTEGARYIARGDLQTRIRTSGGDEIASLGRAFNEMAESLSISRQELTEKNEELQRVNRELRQMQEQFVRSERLAAIGQLAAGVSHEIDNPVGIILGYAELLLEDTPVDDPRREDLQAIIDESKRCRRITGGLLGFARGTPHRFEQIQVADLVNATLAALRPQKLFRNLDMRLEQRQAFPLLWTDSDQLRQVLINLLLNAAQALGGVGTLQIKLDIDQEFYLISVEDSGPGVAVEMREKIFEPFVSTKSGGEGTGLGLSVSRRLIEDLGGRLYAGESSLGGAVFHISLPRSLAEKCFDNETMDSLG